MVCSFPLSLTKLRVFLSFSWGKSKVSAPSAMRREWILAMRELLHGCWRCSSEVWWRQTGRNRLGVGGWHGTGRQGHTSLVFVMTHRAQPPRGSSCTVHRRRWCSLAAVARPAARHRCRLAFVHRLTIRKTGPDRRGPNFCDEQVMNESPSCGLRIDGARRRQKRTVAVPGAQASAV